MPYVNEYGRKRFKPPGPPAPPRPPGRGPLGNRPEDYGRDVVQQQPLPKLGNLTDLAPSLQPLRSGPTAARAALQERYGLSPGTALRVGSAAEAAAAGQAALQQQASGSARPAGALGNRPEDYGVAGSTSQEAPGQTRTVAPTSTASIAQNALRTFTTEGGGGTSAPATSGPTISTTGGPINQAAPVASTASATASASPTGTDVFTSVSQDLQRDLASLGTNTNEAIASKSQYYQQLMDLLEQTRKDLIAQSEKDGKELDPSTLLTLDRLKQDAQEGLKSVREVANRRGILDSGIALGMEQDVNKAYGQQETQVLSDRLSRIQENLQTGLRQLSGQAIDVQGRKVADLSGLQDKFLQARQTARERAQQRQDSWQRYQTDRSDRQAAEAAQNALRYSDLTGNVIVPVSQADSMLAEAKRRYNAAKDAGDQAGMAAAAEMGRQARALGPTLDPGNTMSYDQLQGAVQGGQSVFSQVQQGAPTYQAAQAARKALQSAAGGGASQQASGPAAPQPTTNGMSRQWDETSYTDVENWIGQARKNGLTAPEIAAALKSQGIDPWDFNIRH